MEKLTLNPEFKSLIPPLSSDEYGQLEENILAEGCRDALVTWRGTVVDGHNRYEICTKNGITYQTVEKEFEDKEQVKEWIILNQFGRRNLSPHQRAVLALDLKPIMAAKAKKNQATSTGGANPQLYPKLDKADRPKIDTLKELAQIAGVSRGTIHEVETIQNKAPESIKKAVEANEISISKGYALTKQVKDLPEEKREEEAQRLLAEPRRKKAAAKKDEEPAIEINIQDTPELQAVLEQMVSSLGIWVGQAETLVNELPELGEIKHTLRIYVDALHKYAERLDSTLKLKLRGEKRKC